MFNQLSAIKSELSRVRELKRNAESTIELLRSDMEKGKIHLRVSEDKDFRARVASAVVAMAHPGYSTMAQGSYYADPVEGEVYHRESQAAWNPWSDSISWRIVSVDELVNQDNNNFSPCVDDWALALEGAEFSFSQILEAYALATAEEEDGGTRDEDGDLKEWVWQLKDEAIAWAAESEEFSETIQEAENLAHEMAIDFALSEIQDEIIIEPLLG